MLTFEVYPTMTHLPTTQDVSREVDAILLRELERMGIKEEFRIKCGLTPEKGDSVSCDPTEPFWAKDPTSFWLHILDRHGGVRVFCDDVREDILIARDEICRNQTLPVELIDRALGHGREWSFRSYAGRSVFGQLLLGCSVAALASLVKGIVYGEEGHWIDSQLPIAPEDFLSVYFEDSKLWREGILSEL